MKRIALLALVAFAATGAVHAAELRPLAAQTITLAGVSGVVYYTKEEAGFRVVTTLAPASNALPVRFITTLADGQSAIVSVPVDVGQAGLDIEIVRKGESITVGEAYPVMVRAALD